MPTVNLPLAQSNVTLPSTPSRLVGLSLHAVVIFAALFWFGHRFATRYRQSRITAQRVASQADPAGFSRDQQTWRSEKQQSRGVSNQFGMAMSANQGAEITQLNQGEEFGVGSHGVAPRRSQESLNGHHEEMAGNRGSGVGVGRSLQSRPPPPPPMTLPTLSPSLPAEILTFEKRRLSAAVSTMGHSELDSNFFEQPNPDYTSSSVSSGSHTSSSQTDESQAVPRRRSYTKMVPLGPTELVSAAEQVEGVSISPSSFPSSSPILPLAPHDSFVSREIDVQGEIISVTDDSGAGWKRHTRVYGGGVCLACLASEGQGGGFYGDRVRPEERRR